MSEPFDINELLFRLLENELSDEDFARLKEWLCSGPEAVAYYYQFIHDYSFLSATAGPEMNTDTPKQSCDSFNKQLWTMLAEHEKTAPAKPAGNANGRPETPVLGKIEIPQSPRRTNKSSLVVAMVGIAALALLILYLHFNPYPAGQEVATLMDSMNAEVSDTFLTVHGARLSTYHGPVELKKGILNIRYDSGVDVIIEGPAAFEMATSTEIILHHGKIFTQVGESGKGFAVSTQNSKIIDLGTQFGVIADAAGDTEVHVFKGQTMLVAGAHKEKKTIMNLASGLAGRISGDGTVIKDIQVNASAFIRGISSKTGLIWKGQSIPLTNILAGTLFDEAPEGIELNPENGQFVRHENYVGGTERRGSTDYQKIDSAFVDGTFIPLGEQPQIISSTKLTYQFPKTSGSFHFNLSDRKTVYDGYTDSRYPIFAAAADTEKPLIFLHPNMGVTFDLEKVRDKIAGLEIQRFHSKCGITPSAAEALKKAYPDGNIPAAENPGMDFFVLIDGKISQTLTGIDLESGILRIEAEIPPTARFLTLASTDGNQCFKYDWFVLADPVLEIAAAE